MYISYADIYIYIYIYIYRVSSCLKRIEVAFTLTLVFRKIVIECDLNNCQNTSEKGNIKYVQLVCIMLAVMVNSLHRCMAVTQNCDYECCFMWPADITDE